MKSSASQEKQFGLDLGLIHEVVVAGRKVFADREFWAQLAHHKDLFSQVVQVVKHGWSGISNEKTIAALKKKAGDAAVSYEVACLIMGAHNIIGLNQVEVAFNTKHSAEQLAQLYTCVPFSWDVLLKARNKGFRLIAGRELEFPNLVKMMDCSITDAPLSEKYRHSRVQGTSLTWYLIHPDIHFGGGSYETQLHYCHNTFGTNASLAPAGLLLYVQLLYRRLYQQKLFSLEIRCNDFLGRAGGAQGKALRPSIRFESDGSGVILNTIVVGGSSTGMAVVVHIVP